MTKKQRDKGFREAKRERLSLAFLSVTLCFLTLFLYAGQIEGVFDRRNETLPEVSQTVFGRVEQDLSALYEENCRNLSLSARQAVLLTADGGLLYGKNENEKAGMASTTKIMTGLLAAEFLEEAGRDAETVVSENAAGIEGSSIYLKVGERVKVMDLLYATLLASANDGASALAEAIAGDIPSFVDKMNEKARELGLAATHFENPHGLASEEHYTTAYELGLLASFAMKNPIFASVVATRNYTFKSEDMIRSLSNHNRMLVSYQGVVGVKTGFTKATGRCLVTAAERNGVKLIAVTLNAPDDWQDHTAMLDQGFSQLQNKTLLGSEELSFTLPSVCGTKASLSVGNREALTAVLPENHGEITYRIELPSFVYAPIEKGETVGQCVFLEDGKRIASVPLVAKESVDGVTYKRSFVERITDLFGF